MKSPTTALPPQEGKEPKLTRRNLALIAVAAAAIVIAFALAMAALPPTSSSNEVGAGLQDRTLGSSVVDFWPVYPSVNPRALQGIAHPEWVLTALATGPVMILVHQEGCVGCAFQEPVCDRLGADHADNLTYFSLLGGRDDQRLMEAMGAYDPDGGTHYVPLTILVTERTAGNSTVIAFHSWEGAIRSEALNSWLVDAIDHFPTAA